MFEGTPIRIRRPADYQAAVAVSLGPSQPNPNLNLAAVGIRPNEPAAPAPTQTGAPAQAAVRDEQAGGGVCELTSLRRALRIFMSGFNLRRFCPSPRLLRVCRCSAPGIPIFVSRSSFLSPNRPFPRSTRDIRTQRIASSSAGSRTTSRRSRSASFLDPLASSSRSTSFAIAKRSSPKGATHEDCALIWHREERRFGSTCSGAHSRRSRQALTPTLPFPSCPPFFCRYGFVVYEDPAVTDIACAGLHGMRMGERHLTVRLANEGVRLHQDVHPAQEGVEAAPKPPVVVKLAEASASGVKREDGATVEGAREAVRGSRISLEIKWRAAETPLAWALIEFAPCFLHGFILALIFLLQSRWTKSRTTTSTATFWRTCRRSAASTGLWLKCTFLVLAPPALPPYRASARC